MKREETARDRGPRLMTGLLSTCVRAEQTPPQESPVKIEVTVNTRFLRAEASELQASEVSFGKRRGWRGFLTREGG